MCEGKPPTTSALLEFLHSEPFCRLLSHLTGLDLAENVIRLTEQRGEPCSSATINTECSINGRLSCDDGESASEQTVCVYTVCE